MAEGKVCELVLEKPVTKDVCYDFRAVRRRVLCTAWQLVEKERIPFKQAIKRAWRDVKKECAEFRSEKSGI